MYDWFLANTVSEGKNKLALMKTIQGKPKIIYKDQDRFEYINKVIENEIQYSQMLVYKDQILILKGESFYKNKSL